MSHIAAITVKHPDLALTPTLDEVPDLDVEIESQPATAANSPVLFYSVKTPSFHTFESALGTDHTIADWQSISEFNEHRIYQMELSSETKVITPKITTFRLRVLSATNGDGGWHLRLHTAEKSQVAQFQTYCHQEDVECQIQKVYSTGSQHTTPGSGNSIQLTDRQHEVAQTATEMGYFDNKGATAEEVARELDITPSTLSSHLRTIKAKLFKHHFGSSLAVCTTSLVFHCLYPCP